MPTMRVDLESTNPEYLGQVRYAMTFVSEDVVSYEILEPEGKVVIELRPGADVESMQGKVQQLLERYRQNEFGMKSAVYLDQARPGVDLRQWAPLGNSGRRR